MKFLTRLVILIYLLFLSLISIYADNNNSSDIDKKAEMITSIQQVKLFLKKKLIYLEKNCATGSCKEAVGSDICNYIALVDLRLNGSIIQTMTDTQKKPAFSISNNDKILLQRIYDSCKMSNYQYWNYPTIAHITFLPSQIDKQWIYQQLGLKSLLEKLKNNEP